MKRIPLFILFFVSTSSYGSLQVQQEPDTAILLKEVVVMTPQRMEQSKDVIVEAASTQDRLSGSDKQDSRIAKGRAPGWTLVNTRFQYVYRNFYLQTGIQNIFNTAYRIYGSGVDGVGRSFWISLAELSSLNHND